MEFTNEKNIKFNSSIINSQSIYYLITSALGLCLYLLCSRVLSFFIPTLPAGIIGGAVAAAAYFYAAGRYVFIHSTKKLAWRIVFFVLQCLLNSGIYYLLVGIVQPWLDITKEICALTAFAVIIIVNYFISSILIFKSAVQASERTQGRLFRCVLSNRFVLLAGAAAAFIMLFVYFCYNAYPFGDITILRMDLYHQYGPLFGELYDRIENGQGLLYSWVSGGGSLFLGNFFNYLSSPISLIVFLFDREQIPGAISMIILVKAVLSASSFTLYLKLSKKNTSFLTAGFGLLYAFCGFFLAYYWNVMWIDALYLLPMIAYGIESIIHRGKFGIYTTALIVMMFSNYYMSFIICIFSVLYFITYYFCNYNPSTLWTHPELGSKKRVNLWNKKLIRAGVIFAGASVLAAAVSAVALLPTYFALQSSSATAGTFPTELSTYFDFFDFLSNHLTGIETTIRSSGGDVLPNISSGMIVLILIPLYMMNKSIPVREKAMHILLLAVLVASFNTNVMNYIWHAFHFPNDLPYRFSFLYTFIILNMSFRVLTKFRDIQYRDIVLVGMLILLFVTLAEKMPNKYFKENLTVYVAIVFTILYACILTLVKKKTLGASVLSFLLFLTMGVEIIVGSTDSYVVSQTYDNYAGDYGNYQKILDKIALYEKNSADMPRTEQFHLRTRMDPCWYGYNGISTFSSMAYEKMSRLQYSLGMYGNRINSYTYNPQTPVYNAMFALKYFIGTDQNLIPNSEYYTKLFTDGSGDITVYENKYYLPLAYCVTPSIDNWYFEEGNPFEVQNSFIRTASGVNQVFRPVPVDYTSRVNVKDFDFKGNGSFTYEKYSEGDASVTFTLTPEENGNVYFYASSYGTKKATVTSERINLTYDFDTAYILDAGYHQAGEEITVTFTIGDSNTSTINFYSYFIDKEAYEEAYNYFNQGAYQITHSSDTKIEGTVYAPQYSVLYTSIPYDEGWHVYVDGKKTDIFPVGDAVIGLEMAQGQHTVEFKYTPAGLKLGGAITIASLLGTACYAYISYTRKGRKSRNDSEYPVI